MGFSISYIASKREPEKLAQAFGLEIAGTTDEQPSNDWWVAKFGDGGWSVLWCENVMFVEESHDLIRDVSQSADVIACEVEEHSMWSSAEYLSGGKSDWRVTHAGGDDGVLDLKTEGVLPAAFDEIKEKQFVLQEDEDDCDYVFEVPLDLAAHFIKFRHDAGVEPGDVATFHVLSAPAASAPAKRGFLSRLFGRQA